MEDAMKDSGSPPKIDPDPDEDVFCAADKNGNLKPQAFEGHIGDEEEVKKLLGFSNDIEEDLYPLVDKQSMLLFEGVKELELKSFNAITNVLVPYNDPPNSISNSLLPQKKGSQPTLSILKVPIHIPKGSRGGVALAKLRKPFHIGWKRTVQKKVYLGPNIGEVTYVSPQGVVLKNLTGTAKYLKENSDVALGIENFTFCAKPIGIKGEEVTTIRSKTPLKKGKVPKQGRKSTRPQTAVSKPAPIKNNPVRRSIQPPKRYATGETSGQPDKKSKMAPKVEFERSVETIQ